MPEEVSDLDDDTVGRSHYERFIRCSHKFSERKYKPFKMFASQSFEGSFVCV